MFGDNESVVNSSSGPEAKLHKRHVALSFYRVQEAVASNMLSFIHSPGELHPADLCSQLWGYRQIWKLFHILMFYQRIAADTLQRANCVSPHSSPRLGSDRIVEGTRFLSRTSIVLCLRLIGLVYRLVIPVQFRVTDLEGNARIYAHTPGISFVIICRMYWLDLSQNL